jgi:adenylate cyclase
MAPSELRLADIRPCLEGAIPAVMATAGADGMPNVAYVSQVFFADDGHVALSFQFFNKTRHNILANPQTTVLVVHPLTGAFFRLHLRYARTVDSGPVFEAMKAQLAGIASHTGMAGVFQLRGSDIYEVLHIESVPGQPLVPPPPRCAVLADLRSGSQRLARCTTLEELLGVALDAMRDILGTEHAMVLMLDPVTQRLYTVASCGYATSGVGSEIDLGDGVIGVAAQQQTPVRIMHMTNAYLYHAAVRSSWRNNMPDLALDTHIPYPGLKEPHSQLAVPLVSASQLRGALFAESPQELRFDFEQEDMLVAFAGQLAAAMHLLDGNDLPELSGATPATAQAEPRPSDGRTALRIRHYRVNNSIFIDDDYLIKGVAGAIFWKLVNDHQRLGRCEFSNRELRLDPAIGLPELTDNLEARLLLLQRRLTEHAAVIRIEKTGRGRFRLHVPQPMQLIDDKA